MPSKELGIELINTKIVGNMVSTIEGKIDNITIVYGESRTLELKKDDLEILQCGWFSKQNVPTLGPVAREIWERYLSLG